MKRNRTMKRLLAMLLTIVLTTVCLPAQALAEALTPSGDPADPANAVTAQSAAPEGDAAEETTVYYEVSFALPGSATAEEAEKTTLPETQMLPAGTALASIATPRQIGSVFLGWYYDEALTRMAGPNDTVEANLTLYARFGLREDLEGEYATDYIAVEDVAPEYRVLVSAHNLTADDIRGRLAVRDVSRGGEAIDFTVEEVVEEQPEPVPEEPFSLDALALDEETRAGVEELVQRKASNPEYALGAALRELELDPETVDAILKGCAPEEYEAEQSVNWMDADMMALAETAGLSGDFSGLLDLNAVYGLEDDDSPERYWREELELEPEQVLLLSDIVREMNARAWANIHTFAITPSSGAWKPGDTQQVEILDTECLRFIDGGEEASDAILYYNLTVPMEEFDNLKLNDDVVFVPLSDVEGVGSLTGIYNLVTGEDQQVQTMTDENVLTTDADLAPGMTVAVYDGTLNSDNTVDGDVGYFRIVSDLGGGRYGYTGAEFTDVINVPHVFPLADDGSFDDGVVTVSAETLAFTDPIYKELGFDAGTRMRVGDFVYFYSGRPASVAELDERGVGRITDLAPEGDGLRVAYDPATMNDIHTSADMYVKIPQLDIPLNDYDQEGIRQAMLRQVEESGFVESAGRYVTGLICGEEVLPDDPEMADALKKMTFNTDDGGEMSLDELRTLAGGASRVEVSNPEVSFKLSRAWSTSTERASAPWSPRASRSPSR